jgi:hypothetical protein
VFVRNGKPRCPIGKKCSRNYQFPNQVFLCFCFSPFSLFSLGMFSQVIELLFRIQSLSLSPSSFIPFLSPSSFFLPSSFPFFLPSLSFSLLQSLSFTLLFLSPFFIPFLSLSLTISIQHLYLSPFLLSLFLSISLPQSHLLSLSSSRPHCFCFFKYFSAQKEQTACYD